MPNHRLKLASFSLNLLHGIAHRNHFSKDCVDLGRGLIFTGPKYCGVLPPPDCALKCAVDSRKQPTQDSKTEGRGVAIFQAGHTKRGQPVLCCPPLLFTLNQEVEGSNPSWTTNLFKGLSDSAWPPFLYAALLRQEMRAECKPRVDNGRFRGNFGLLRITC